MRPEDSMNDISKNQRLKTILCFISNKLIERFCLNKSNWYILIDYLLGNNIWYILID